MRTVETVKGRPRAYECTPTARQPGKASPAGRGAQLPPAIWVPVPQSDTCAADCVVLSEPAQGREACKTAAGKVLMSREGAFWGNEALFPSDLLECQDLGIFGNQPRSEGYPLCSINQADVEDGKAIFLR